MLLSRDTKNCIIYIYNNYNKGPPMSNPITETPVTTEVVAPTSPKKNYLNNKDLLFQVVTSKKKGIMSNELANMLLTLTSRYAKKGNFANYSYNDDMQAYAMLMLCKTWSAFDENKSSNPFAFFTQCIKHSFIQYLNQERRVRDIKNKSLIENGFNPSLSYTLDHEEEFHERREAMINGNLDEYARNNVTIVEDTEFSDPDEVKTETDTPTEE